MVIWRWLRMRPVTQGASFAGNPVDPPAAPMAVEDPLHELVLDGVL